MRNCPERLRIFALILTNSARRRFLKQAVAAPTGVAASQFVASHVLGADGSAQSEAVEAEQPHNPPARRPPPPVPAPLLPGPQSNAVIGRANSIL